MIRATLTDKTPMRLVRLERTDDVLSTRELALGDTIETNRPVQHEALWAFLVSPGGNATVTIVGELENGTVKEGDLVTFEEISVVLIPVGGDLFRADFLGRGLAVVGDVGSKGDK